MTFDCMTLSMNMLLHTAQALHCKDGQSVIQKPGGVLKNANLRLTWEFKTKNRVLLKPQGLY